MREKTGEEKRALESQVKEAKEVTTKEKKVYVVPKLSYEGKWDTVTMQFGGSVVIPPP